MLFRTFAVYIKLATAGMGVLLALLVFIYPLGLPVVTVGSYIALVLLCSGRARAVFAFGALLTAGLVLALAPGVLSSGAGAFALPWWLHAANGQSAVKYYALEYTVVCLALLACSVGGAAVYRLIARRQPVDSSQSRVNKDSERFVIAREFAALQASRHNPDQSSCPACARKIVVVMERIVGEEGRQVFSVSCACGKCNGDVVLST